MPEPRHWRAARPHLVRIANAVRPRLAGAATTARQRLARLVRTLEPWFVRTVKPHLARLVRTVKPQLTRLVRTVKPQLARIPGPRAARTWQYTAGAATAGLALAVGVVTAAGPWDATGQRTAERDRAAALGRAGGTDHGGDSGTAAAPPRPAPSAAPVLTGLGGTAQAADAAHGGKPLADVLGPLLDVPALGAAHAAAVVDAASGERLYGSGADKPLTPASTTKIATAVAALSALGPDHRLTTRTALEPGTGRLVLVGGGDPTLTARKEAGGWASLRTLATDTAKALRARGVRQVTLSHDSTLYAGSGLHPIGVNDNLARVDALMADEGRTDGSASGPAPRVSDPAAAAARTFAGLLADAGVRTTASAPAKAKATARAETLATVFSPPLSEVVERMLTNSDNDLGEALARQTAVATGVRADFAGGGRAIAAQLTKLGLPTAGAVFHDGSGLNRDDRLTAHLLTALLAKAASPARPDLRPVLTGLPVAGFSGTLSDRYKNAAAGLVRAKTGTLTGVNSLAGTVVARDGRLLAFAFLASNTTNPTEAQTALDTTATALTN
ncbi:D-alanyl-D-alanine carboxypeptidase/D-alanyl-D-alanine-endopeptidase [Streptomyces sp. NPDC006012]|uniref:D-alanyl-D-alanine carboxypeptidase/D-alanyl-D-alanine endopeptidase n=1 Tax=Streptomyces sp. NPDC006012 TaxID=3364739 RepID=UPI0036A08762